MDFSGESVRVVGVGGSGCAACERMGFSGCVAVHTDATSLLKHQVKYKVLIGKDLTKGRSTGNNIMLGEQAAIADRDKISTALEGAKLTFIIAGLGGGTGAGASPIVAEVAKSSGSTVIAFVNIPFTAEGKLCRANAKSGLENLRPYCDLIVVLENDRCLKIVPDLSVRDAFIKVNTILLETVKGMLKLISESGIDEVKPILKGYGTIGQGFGKNIVKAVEAALDCPLISVDPQNAYGVLLSLTSKSKGVVGLSEVMETITGWTNDEIRIVWTNTVDEKIEGTEAMIVLTGVEPPIQVF